MSEQITILPDYLQKESEYLRSRLTTNIDETASLEKYAIATTGAIWAWLGTHDISAIPVLYWLPFLLTTFLGIRAIAVYIRIKTIRNYLAKIENSSDIPKGLCWAATFEVSGARYRLLTASIFWWGINAVNLVIALVVLHKPVLSIV